MTGRARVRRKWCFVICYVGGTTNIKDKHMSTERSTKQIAEDEALLFDEDDDSFVRVPDDRLHKLKQVVLCTNPA